MTEREGMGTGSSAKVARTGSWIVRGTSALACLALLLALAPCVSAAEPEGIHKIQHVVMLMQENHSFDSYFGTYPGANGIPAGVCVPDPTFGGCVKPFHDPTDENLGGPHGTAAAIADIDGGKMDGFVREADGQFGCTETGGCAKCSTGTDCAMHVMGYHDAREIPNYWTYAQKFVLQDNMFESAASWSLPEHLYLVSGWSARCPFEDTNPLDCTSSLSPIPPAKYWSEPVESPPRATYAWTDVTHLLATAGVSWRYYIAEGIEPDCEDDETVICKPVTQNSHTAGIWNPLADFTDVKQAGQLGNIQSLNNFYTAAHEETSCGLPNVSWIAPSVKVSEHYPGLISKGQTYVTTVINTIMRSPCWKSTAIFLSWDDWGGFYDHVIPHNVDENGYGLRVPGLVISPYAKAGFIDHQQLSHDAYLKFIEDDFLGGARLNPATDGRADKRPDVREEAPGLGDLANDFNFQQSPRPPLLLPVHPEPGPASTPPDPTGPSVTTEGASGLGQTAATLGASVNPNGSAVSDCHFEYGTSVFYESSQPCSSLPGSGTASVAVSAQVEGLSANTAYHFRIVATNAGGTSYGADQSFTTLPNPPTVETGAASELRQTAATLGAGVNPNGGAVSDCHFEYGTSVFYGSSRPCSSLPGSGTIPVAVSARVEGLSANTAYHFRIVAGNAGGTSYGADQSFTTLPNPPTVTALSPGSGPVGGGTTVTISGTNLSGATAVTFGTAGARTFTVTSATSISAVSPAEPAGSVDVTVSTRGGTSAISSADQFRFRATVSSVSPNIGPTAGGTPVLITGSGFGVGSSATKFEFGTVKAVSVNCSSSTECAAVSPAHEAGTVDVRAIVNKTTSAKNAPADQFTYG